MDDDSIKSRQRHDKSPSKMVRDALIAEIKPRDKTTGSGSCYKMGYIHDVTVRRQIATLRFFFRDARVI